MGQIALILGSIILLIALTLIEALRPARRERPQRLVNLLIWAVSLAVQLALLPTITSAAASVVHKIGAPSLNIARWPLIFSLPVFFVAMDLGEYSYHRAQHAIPWLWTLHALHHSDPCVNATTTSRHWWGDPALKTITVWQAAILLTGPGAADVVIWTLCANYHLFVHANLPISFGRFSWLLNSPAYHRRHHSRDEGDSNTNFASLFPIFDVLCGSYRRPSRIAETGLNGLDGAVLAVMLWPLPIGMLRTRTT